MENAKLTKEEELQNNQVVYGEACESRRRQHADIGLLNNKINWLFGSALVIIGFLLNAGLNDSPLYLLAFVFLFISAAICLISFFPKSYRDGPKLKDVHEKRNKLHNVEFFTSINKRVIEDLEENKTEIAKFKWTLITSSSFLIAALILITLTFFNLCK